MDPVAAIWAVAIGGERQDIEDARVFLAHPDNGLARIGDITRPDGLTYAALFSDSFQPMEAAEVHIAAERLLGLINGLLFLQDAARVPLRLLPIHRRREDKWDMGTIFGEGKLRERGDRIVANAVAQDGSGTPASARPPLPQHFAWLRLALADDDARDVLLFLRASNPDWFDFYKVWEFLKSARGQTWWSEESYKDLKYSANLERHSRRGTSQAPAKKRKRISFENAQAVTRQVAERWLEWKAAQATPAPSGTEKEGSP